MPLNIEKLLTEVDELIRHYGTVANDLTNSSQDVKDFRGDPFEAQKILVQGMQIQSLAGEYYKLAAQLQSVRLAHKVAAKSGFKG